MTCFFHFSYLITSAETIQFVQLWYITTKFDRPFSIGVFICILLGSLPFKNKLKQSARTRPTIVIYK